MKTDRIIHFFLCFGRGTSIARRDHGGGLALSESSRGYCRSWYDAEITRNRQWTQRITEDLPDASKMYDWKQLKKIILKNQQLIFLFVNNLLENNDNFEKKNSTSNKIKIDIHSKYSGK